MHAKLTPKQVDKYLFGVWCISYMSYWIYCVIAFSRALNFWNQNVSSWNSFLLERDEIKNWRKTVKLMMECNLHHLYNLVHTRVKHFTCCHGSSILKTSNCPLISWFLLDFFHNSQWFHFKHPNWLYCS